MASRREQNMKYRRYSGRVNGNLAYDPAYEERQRRLRPSAVNAKRSRSARCAALWRWPQWSR